MKKFIFPILFLLTLAACKQDAKSANTDEQSPVTPTTKAGIRSGSGELQLTCEDMGAAGDMPKNAIFAIVGERKTKLREITSACMELQSSSYAGYGIPADAVAAIGSWFAGIGDFFFAKQEGDQINIYYSAIGEEGPPAGVHTYYKLATYENGKITVHELQ